MILASVLVLFTSGCGYITGSITDIVGDIVPELSDKVQSVEVATGALEEQVTLNGYRVQASVGAVVDKVYLVTPMSGYRVYQGVQGQTISE